MLSTLVVIYARIERKSKRDSYKLKPQKMSIFWGFCFSVYKVS